MMRLQGGMSRWLWAHGFGIVALRAMAAAAPLVSASSFDPACAPAGACDGDRFSVAPGSVWRGSAGATSWWWQVRFPALRRIGAILQIVGDHDFALRHAPRRYVWQGSMDGIHWQDWPETAVADESRLFRLHRLERRRPALYARLRVAAAVGNQPVLREVEFFDDPAAVVPFPPWILVVNTTHERAVPGHGQEFIGLARACPGWKATPAQQVWLGTFDTRWIAVEPRPLCAFLSGNFKDWCEVDRESWRGTQTVLREGSLPLWASCGGAQGLALISEYGVDHRWDCPHCRDPGHPQTPLYGHIGHTRMRPCGDYSGCIFERGPHAIRFLGHDPVFAGMPEEAPLMESHCGQIEWPPRGWILIAGAGAGTLTKIQCLKRADRPIYAAQFHIEMAGTPEASQRIMANFLDEALAWRARPARREEPVHRR